MGFCLLFIAVTNGFGILCIWPILIIGFLLFIGGIFIPSHSQILFQRQFDQKEKNDIKRICSNCGATQSIDSKQCSQCGKKFYY